MSTFNCEIWDPVLLSTSSQNIGAPQTIGGTRKQTSRQSIDSGSAPQAIAQPSNTHASSPTGMSPLSVDTQQPSAKHSLGEPKQSELGLQNATALKGPVSPVPRKTGIMYRIFHMGEQTPTEEDEQSGFLFGRSRRSYNSGSEAESDEGDSEDSQASRSGSLFRRRPTKSNAAPPPMTKEQPPKKGIFSVGDESSDYESEMEEPRKKSGGLFRDFLTGSRKSRASKASLNKDGRSTSANSVVPPEIDEPSQSSHSIFKDLLAPISKKTKSSSSQLSDKPPVQRSRSPSFSNPFTTNTEPSTPPERSLSELSLFEKYGRTEDVIGRGAYATVKLCCPMNSSKKYAVKEFRPRRRDESQKDYVKKLIAEFCISSSLDHENVVKTVDLIQDNKKQWCVVMEYCSGGDLYSRVSNGSLKNYVEIDCYFKQLTNGVHYLHQMGVSHRDLKPENLLVDSTGRILKITDFGVSEVFRAPFGTITKKTHGIAGSGPYIAPEEFDHPEYDSEPIDVWAIGIIYFVCMSNSILWKSAISSDIRFKYYLDHLSSYHQFEKLRPGPRAMLYRLLNPDPSKRITLVEILDDAWFKSLSVCNLTNRDTVDHRHESCSN